MLQALHPLEAGDRVEELHPHRAQHGPQVQEEQVAAAPRRLHRVLDELHDRLRLEHGAPAEAEITCGTHVTYAKE